MPYKGGFAQGSGLKVVRGRYDFTVDGGAIGTIDLMVRADIPSGAIVLGGYVEVTVAPTSGGSATVAVQVEGAGDTVGAAVVSGAPWSTTGRKSVIPVFTGASTLKTTAARKIQAVVAVAALTAGAFDVVLFYLRPMD